MKKILAAGVLAVSLSALAAPPAEAKGIVPALMNCLCSNCGPSTGCPWCPAGVQLGPWYLYWPMEAHFQVAAPTGYPNWPSAMSLPSTWGYTAQPPAFGPYQKTSFGGAPSYWYGH